MIIIYVMSISASFSELFLQNIANMCRIVHDVVRYVATTQSCCCVSSAASLNDDDDDNPDLDCETTTENNAMWTTTVQIC